LLDLESAWALYDHFFLTEDTALSRSVAENHRAIFVPHVALGQARLGAPVLMGVSGLHNFIRSALIVMRERPDVVITTGAGSVYFGVLWSRILGAKIVVIESFARFDRPSAFAKIAAMLAHQKIVQSESLLKYWPDAKLFDPFRVLNQKAPKKDSLLFVTVGATLPFDRMVQMVADLKARGGIAEQVRIQTGVGGMAPTDLEVFETLSFAKMQETMVSADIVVCHGGTGSIITALREGCRVIAVPRLFELGEHYDNHQAEITRAFEAKNLIAVANSPEELTQALEVVRNRPPVVATTDATELTECLAGLLLEWSDGAAQTLQSDVPRRA
jgi:UDP-N-acetylglucosamine--N-acetylmuramyl-(pentapeptide) pyrophosphoryl-undecaprenol N-acetylglucosamine transferase